MFYLNFLLKGVTLLRICLYYCMLDRIPHDELQLWVLYCFLCVFSGVPLNTFMDATEAEIWNIIKLSPVKSCELDPLPTWLLKECKAELVPLITDIVNMSLRESMFPKSLKTALIRPLLKKTGLDIDILKIFRPVSN